MNFTGVVYDETVNTDIARINRATGVLYLNPSIWKRLTADEREFVLLHEHGHLELQTASEYQANKYAIGKFLNVKTLTNAELGKRIQVVTEITDPTRYISGNFLDSIAGIGQVSNETFKIFGIGSKNRAKEAEQAAKNEAEKMKGNQKLFIVGGMFVVVIILLYFTLKK